MAIASLLLAHAAYAEDTYEFLTGGTGAQYVSGPGSSPVLSYGERPTTDFPPKNRTVTRPSVRAEASASYCVRTCDGRY